jgi:hypothetical protein
MLYDLSSPSCKHAFNELCTCMDGVQAQIIKPAINKQIILKIGEKEHIKNRTSTKQKNECVVNQNY